MIKAGDPVEHEEFGAGEVNAVLGQVATVTFFGEEFDVDVNELRPSANGVNPVIALSERRERGGLAFRQSFEAINLGVVPSDPDQLIQLTIRGDEIAERMRALLADAPKKGASRIFLGYYGSGKSHHLQLVKAIALRDGWVTASIELDPKAADPAKPFTVYQALMSGLEFPMRSDGRRNEDFFDLVKEMRDNWTTIRSLKYFSASPWFHSGLEALLHLAHRRDKQDYVSAVNWLAGQVKLIGAIRKVTRQEGYRGHIPIMPQIRENGLIYGFHLVVLNEVLRALGYRGLALIVDEAEHVRSYAINRRDRANNFLDVLARCAHRPRTDLEDPYCDFENEMAGVPPFWREGPHFSLFVGLTEGEDTQDLKRKTGEMSVLIHRPGEVEHLKPPDPCDYQSWADYFMAETATHLGPKVSLLSDKRFRARITRVLGNQYAEDKELLLRNWTKLAGFPAAILLSQPTKVERTDLVTIVEKAARQISGEVFPWDDDQP